MTDEPVYVQGTLFDMEITTTLIDEPEKTYTVDGHTFVLRSERQCYVCTHPQRESIETMLATGGATYAAIIDAHMVVPDRPLSSQGLRRHSQRGHMAHILTQRRATLEEYARRKGLEIEEGAHSLVTSVGFANEVLQQSHRMLALGVLMPSVQDGLNAAKFIEQVESAVEDTLDEAYYAKVFDRYMAATKAVMSPEMFASFLDMLSKDRELLRLLMTEDYVDAEEVVDMPTPDALGSGDGTPNQEHL